MNGQKTKVAAYARVADDPMTTLEAQQDYYSKIINQNEQWLLAKIFADERQSIQRPEFRQMLNLCREGKIDIIITKSMTVFSRNVEECIQTIRKLKRLNIQIYFIKEQMIIW